MDGVHRYVPFNQEGTPPLLPLTVNQRSSTNLAVRKRELTIFWPPVGFNFPSARFALECICTRSKGGWLRLEVGFMGLCYPQTRLIFFPSVARMLRSRSMSRFALALLSLTPLPVNTFVSLRSRMIYCFRVVFEGINPLRKRFDGRKAILNDQGVI